MGGEEGRGWEDGEGEGGGGRERREDGGGGKEGRGGLLVGGGL